MEDPNYMQSNQTGNQPASQQPPASQPATQAFAVQPKPSTSGLAIAGLVLGIAAILTSFLPFVNNASFFVALIGLVLSIIGLLGIRKGKHSGKGLAVAGIVLCVLSCAIVLATQAFFSASLDAASKNLTNGSASLVTSGSSASSAAQAASASSNASQAKSDSGEQKQPETDYQNLPVGQTINLKSGLKVTVNSITSGLSNFDGSEVVCVNVTYSNGGSKNESFNVYDWKAEDAGGAQRSTTYYSNAENQLNSGSLSAGGQVTGNVYFDAPVSKVHYYASIMNQTSTAAWVA